MMDPIALGALPSVNGPGNGPATRLLSRRKAGATGGSRGVSPLLRAKPGVGGGVRAVAVPGAPLGITEIDWCTPLRLGEYTIIARENYEVPQDAQQNTVPIRSWVGRARYSARDEQTGNRSQHCVVFRMNAPVDEGWKEGPVVPVAVFVNGTAGTGVGCAVDTRWNETTTPKGGDDDFASAVLASGVDMVDIAGIQNTAFGRSESSGMLVVHINNPSYGQPSCGTSGDGTPPPPSTRGDSRLSDSLPEWEGVSDGGPGDDNCGPATIAAYDVVMDALFSWLEDQGVEDSTVRLVVVSFSNGAACASAWIAQTSREVHAFIDMEGPTDSYEQLVCAECADPLDQYKPENDTYPELAATLTVGGWSGCVPSSDAMWARKPTADDRGLSMFGAAWLRYYRPPEELLLDLFLTAVLTGSIETPPLPATAPPFEAGVLTWMLDFWQRRKPELHLRSGNYKAYIRINNDEDHVQPAHYKNRHALRALLDAQMSFGCSGSEVATNVYWASGAYLDAAAAPDAASPEVFDTSPDPDEYDEGTWPAWVEVKGFAVTRWPIEVDLVRWAMENDFDGARCS